MKAAFIIHTDGGCEPNPGTGGWAAIVQHPSGCVEEISGREEGTTNNRMELMAAIRALSLTPEGAEVHVHTDSQYLSKGMNTWIRSWKRRGWIIQLRGGGGRTAMKVVKNKDLWIELDMLASLRKVKWIWVRGHNGDALNERCDMLADAARSGVVKNPCEPIVDYTI